LIAGRYLLSEAVGQGGMGRVWRGHDQLLDRTVAVKELILPQQSPAGHAESVARTMREARAAARLDHPSVVTIHDVVEHQGSPWIVMQFISGPSLRSEIDRNGRLPWQQVASLGMQVAEALAVAHGAGIIHRDLKPDNILLSGSRAIVTDFGIARIADATTQLTGAGVLVGTPAYMAPECLDGSAAGSAGDLWALGATLYAAVEGFPPFTGQTMSALITAILTKAPARPLYAGPLLEVLAALLSKSPAQRPDAKATARILAASRSAHAASESTGWFQPVPPAARTALRPQHPQTEVAAAPGSQAPGLRDTITGGRHQAQPPGGSPAGRRRPRRRPATRPALALAGLAAAAAVVGTLLALPRGSQSPGTTSPGTRPPPGQSASLAASASTPAGPATASPIATLTDPTDAFGPPSVASLAFGPDGTLAIGDGGDGNLYLWDTATRSITATLALPDGTAPVSVAFGPNGTVAAVGNFQTFVWNAATGSLITGLSDPGGGNAGSVAPGPGNTLAVGDRNGNTYLWSTTTWKVIATLPGPGHFAATSVALGPDGILAAGDYVKADANPNTYLWDTATKSIIATLPDPGGTGVQALAFRSDGALAVVDTDGNTYLWNTTTRKLIATFASKGGRPLSVAFGPNNTLAVGQVNGETVLWSTDSKSVIANLVGPDGKFVNAVAFGPGNTLAVGDFNGNTYLWHISWGNS
jgi:hypothetical protein